MNPSTADWYLAHRGQCPMCDAELIESSVIGEPGEVQVECLDCGWSDVDEPDPTPNERS